MVCAAAAAAAVGSRGFVAKGSQAFGVDGVYQTVEALCFQFAWNIRRDSSQEQKNNLAQSPDINLLSAVILAELPVSQERKP